MNEAGDIRKAAVAHPGAGTPQVTAGTAATDAGHDHGGRPLREILRECESRCITEALRLHQGSKIEAARELGIGLSSLYRKMKELEIPC